MSGNDAARIFVGNIPFELETVELIEIFRPYGEINERQSNIVTDVETGRSRGFGFVQMEDADSARTAIAKLDKTTLGKRELNVKLAIPKERKPR